MDGEISADELADLIEADADVEIVDIRAPPSYERGHIPGSVNVPFAELPQRVEELAGAERVVTVCPHGKASVQAARLVGSYEGTTGTIESLAHGIDGWRDLGLDWESAEADAATAADEGPDAPF